VNSEQGRSIAVKVEGGCQVIMIRGDYRTMPEATHTSPPGIAFIIGNEAVGRFGSYGMRAILVVFMTNYLLHADGAIVSMTDD